MAYNTLPTETWLELFTYDPNEGILRWKNTLNPAAPAGSMAGGFGHNSGYVVVRYNRTSYVAHRIIWKMMTGVDAKMVDHINGNMAPTG